MKKNFYNELQRRLPYNDFKNKSTKTKWAIALLSIAFVIALVLIIVVGFIFCYIVSVKYGKVVIDLDKYNFSQDRTSIVYAENDDGSVVEIARLHGAKNRIWVDYESMPKNLYNAFIALEDKRFRRHNGVDWIRTVGVMVKGFSQGGSTITQQLIKNLTNENDVTFVRKFNEITYALNLERHYEKEYIIESYLNTIPLGSGCYGVQTAAEVYFGKETSELNLAECAVLASITKAPTRYNPLINPENNKARQEECLKCMLDQHLISKDEYEEAVNYELVFTNSSSYVNTDKESSSSEVTLSEDVQSYYVDFVINCAIDDLMEKYEYDEREATNLIYYGGLKIYSCIDLEIQEIMEDVYENRITFPKEEDTKEKPAVQSAMTIMDYEGRVVGIVGGAGAKTVNRALNMAADVPRQPGSSIKPLSVYGPAIEKNFITWSSLFENYPIILKGRLWPKNYSGRGSEGSYVTVQYALQESLNTVSARVVQMITPKASSSFLVDNFHFSTLTDTDLTNYSSMAVGGMTEGLTSLEMTAAYATFGNGGKYYEPYCYTKITSYDGEEIIIEKDTTKYTQAISTDTANVMCKLLQTVIMSGTGRGYGVSNFTTFAKTGTTSNNYDFWFVGGTPYYVSAVWYGYKKNREISNVSGKPAAKIFKEIMDRVHKNLEEKDFDLSNGIIQKNYCTVTGYLAGDGCTSVSSGWYKISSLPPTCTQCIAPPEETTVDTTIEEPTASPIFPSYNTRIDDDD